ncbi:MAG: ribonuclease H-like domain-containing protein [Candidatus Hodarchaeota archaeon]
MIQNDLPSRSSSGNDGNLDSSISVSEIHDEFGRCVLIEKEFKLDPSVNLKCLFLKTKMGILQNTKHVRGIGEVNREKLARKDVNGLHGLLFHSNASWRRQASNLLAMVKSFCFGELKQQSSIKDFDLLFCFSPERILYLDIETTGLMGSRIFLVGLGFIKMAEKKLVVQQLFARNYEEEYAVVKFTRDIMKKFDCVVSYNGKSFDIPMIDGRTWYYFHSSIDELFYHHVDLMHESRRILGLEKKVKLSVLEQDVMKIDREIDVPSSLIPGIYEDFVKMGDEIDIVSILENLFANVKTSPFISSNGSLNRVNLTNTILDLYRVIYHNLIDITSLHDLMVFLLKPITQKRQLKRQ